MSPDDRPFVFCLHFLGGSGRSWEAVDRLVTERLRLVTIDLPGFGNSFDTPGYSVTEMADWVVAAILAEAPPDGWMLAGHSMGAKVATVVARRAQDGGAGLSGLQHLLLFAGSPPGPEPIPSLRRQTMSRWFTGDSACWPAQAEEFISANKTLALHPEHHLSVVGDVLRANPAAWLAWLEHGSREDWSERVGILRIPATIVSGSEDEDLGASAQSRLMAPHFMRPELVVLENAAHLLPIEQAADVAALMLEAAGKVATRAAIGQGYWDLLHSDRVSRNTRAALLNRADAALSENAASLLHTGEYSTLVSLLDRLVPQRGDYRIDLAASVLEELASSDGDGWRFAALPADAKAWRAGLKTLDRAAQIHAAESFATLPPDLQDRILTQTAAGTLQTADSDGLSAGQMALWFEDVRAGATRAYMAHPLTLSRIGFSGIAYAGDGVDKTGFTQFGIGVREDWEPLPRAGAVR